jgi:copper homeostasis protein
LTSGQKDKAIDGLDLLKKLNKKAGDRIKIMPGSGISNNTIKNFDLFNEIHGSFKKDI